MCEIERFERILFFVVTSDMNQEYVDTSGTSYDAVVQCCYLATCHVYLLFCTAFLEPAPVNFANGCKIKDTITPQTFGDTVKMHDICYLNPYLF